MHEIEPFYNWRYIYTSEQDERSPFFGRVYSEFAYAQAIYNYIIRRGMTSDRVPCTSKY